MSFPKVLFGLLALLAVHANATRVITSSFLFAKSVPFDLISTEEFKPQGERNSRVSLEGNLSFVDFGTDNTFYTELIYSWSTTLYPANGQYNTVVRQTLPDFNFQYVQKKNTLIAVQRGPQPSEHPFWQYQPSPSYCWRETDDGDWDRCALVFAFNEKGNNCVYNGLGTFLIHKTTLALSPMYFQVAQETCGYYKFNNWGFVEGSYIANSIPNKGQVISSFNNEINSLMDVESIYDLPEKVYENTKRSGSAPVWTVTNNPFNTSAYNTTKNVGDAFTQHFSVVYDSKLWASDVFTRAGPHPYPQWVSFPMYSWSKTHFASFLAGILDYQRGCTFPATPSASSGSKCLLDLIVSDWIPEAASVGTWNNVKLRDLINEASGHWNSTAFSADENSFGDPDYNIDFFYSFTNAEKLMFSLTAWVDHRSTTPPGTQSAWVYHTTDTYIAARMMEAVVRKVYPSIGGLVGFHKQYLVDALELSPLYSGVLVTDDIVKQPFGGFGIFAHRNDLARLMEFWAFSNQGKPKGSPRLISTTYYQICQQMSTANQGFFTGRAINPQERYSLGWWSANLIGIYSGNSTLCSQDRINYGSAYGGNRMYISNGVWAAQTTRDTYNYINNKMIDDLVTLIGCPIGITNA